jgi:hypothetical protein
MFPPINQQIITSPNQLSLSHSPSPHLIPSRKPQGTQQKPTRDTLDMPDAHQIPNRYLLGRIIGGQNGQT